MECHPGGDWHPGKGDNPIYGLLFKKKTSTPPKTGNSAFFFGGTNQHIFGESLTHLGQFLRVSRPDSRGTKKHIPREE